MWVGGAVRRRVLARLARKVYRAAQLTSAQLHACAAHLPMQTAYSPPLPLSHHPSVLFQPRCACVLTAAQIGFTMSCLACCLAALLRQYGRSTCPLSLKATWIAYAQTCAASISSMGWPLKICQVSRGERRKGSGSQVSKGWYNKSDAAAVRGGGVGKLDAAAVCRRPSSAVVHVSGHISNQQ